MEPGKLTSFLKYSSDNHFSLQNIPFGTFCLPSSPDTVHAATRIGDFVIDLAMLEERGLFTGEHFSSLGKKVFNQRYLNDFMELGKDYWHEARVTIQNLFSESNRVIQDDS